MPRIPQCIIVGQKRGLMLKSILLFALFFSSLVLAKDDWTVMVVLNGDNNLEKHIQTTLKRIEQVGSSGKVNVIVMYDGLEHNDSKLLYIKKRKNGRSRNKILEQNVEYDMGDVATFSHLVDYSLSNYPAKKYMLLVYTHGRGIMNLPVGDGANFGNDDDGALRLVFSPDETEKTYIREDQFVREIADVLARRNNGAKLDLIVFDSCLMANYGVLQEMSAITNYVVASEYMIALYHGSEFNPSESYVVTNYMGIGINIAAVVDFLNKNPKSDALAVGRQTNLEFTRSYQDGVIDYVGNKPPSYYESTLALFDLQALSDVERMLGQITDQVLALLHTQPQLFDRIYEQLRRQQMVSWVGYLDLGVFAQVIWRALNIPAAKQLYNFLYQQSDFVVDKTIMHLSYDAAGISIFFPSFSEVEYEMEYSLDYYNSFVFAASFEWSVLMHQLQSLYKGRKSIIIFNLLDRYLAGEDVRVLPDYCSVAESEHELLSMLGMSQVIESVAQGEFELLSDHLQLLRQSQRESSELLLYKNELKQFLQKKYQAATDSLQKEALGRLLEL